MKQGCDLAPGIILLKLVNKTTKPLQLKAFLSLNNAGKGMFEKETTYEVQKVGNGY